MYNKIKQQSIHLQTYQSQSTTTPFKTLQTAHPYSLHPRAHNLSHQRIVLFVTLRILKIRQSLQDRHSAIRVQLSSKAMIQKQQRDLHSHLPSPLPHFESPWKDREEVAAAKDRSLPLRSHCDRRPTQSAIEQSIRHISLQPTFNAGRRMARCRWLRSGSSK